MQSNHAATAAFTATELKPGAHLHDYRVIQPTHGRNNGLEAAFGIFEGV